MWIEDLQGYGQSASVIAVGWLERGHDYTVGEVSAELYDKVEALLVDPWQPAVAAGSHACDLCLYKGEKRGTKNLFVPDQARIFVCPELILHYMNAHRYRPPDEFCEAVMK